MTVVDRIQGLSGSLAIKVPCRAATTANITLSGLQTVDGVSLVADDRVLVKNQTTASENGIYLASTSTWQRALDFDGTADVAKGTLVGVTDGTANASTHYELTTANPILIGTSAITFVARLGSLTFQASGAGAVALAVQTKLRQIVNVDDFGGDFAVAFAAAVVVEVSQDTTYSASFSVPAGKRLINRGRLTGTVSVAGAFISTTNSVTLSGTAGVWTNYPAGTTVFAGDFSAYAVNDFVVVELTTSGSASFNEAGKDFGVVTAADGSSLTINTATRYAYDIPKISKATGLKVTASLTRAATSISGDYTTKFSAGDIIRVENINGTDTVDSSDDYFEQVRIKSLNASAITLEVPLAYSYTDFYLVKILAVSDIQVSGGYFDTLSLNGGEKISVRNIECRRLNGNGLYDFSFSNVRCVTDQPIGVGLTWCRSGVVTDVIATDATGSTDNAAFKIMGCIEVAVDNTRCYDTSASAQGVYPFFVDYLFTPYKGFAQDCTLSNLVCGKASSGSARSALFIGMRGGSVNNVSAAAQIDIEKCVNTIFSTLNTPVNFIEARDCTGIVISPFICKYLNVSGCPGSTLGPGITTGAAGANSGRNVWVRSGTLLANSDGANLIGIKNNSTTAGDRSFYLQNSAGLFLDGCRDNAGLTTSISVDTGLSGTVLGAHHLQNPMGDTHTLFTVTIEGSTAAGAGTYTVQHCTYQKIGRFVLIRGLVQWTAHTGTGDMRLILPFTHRGGTNFVGTLYLNVTGFAFTGPEVYGLISNSTNYATVRQVSTAGTDSVIGIQAAGTIRFTGMYEFN